MAADRMTVAQWVHYLEGPDVQLTLSEFMALCLLHIRENVKDARLGTQHLEGIVGTLDEWLADSNSIYHAIAAKRSRPAPAIGEAAEPPARWPTAEETPATCPGCGIGWDSTDLRRHPTKPLPWWRCSECSAEWNEIIRKHATNGVPHAV